MDLNLLIPGFALCTQLLSVFFALRLTRYAEKRGIAIVFILSICLMIVRQVISLYPVHFTGPAN